MHEGDESMFAALKAAARGYLLKGSNQQETLRAITQSLSGEGLLMPSVLPVVFLREQDPPGAMPDSLSPVASWPSRT